MLISVSDACVTLVGTAQSSSNLVVYAEVAGDIERVFPGVTATPANNGAFTYRAELSRDQVASVLMTRVLDINYDQFEDSMPDPARKAVYRAFVAALRNMTTLLSFSQRFKANPDELNQLELSELYRPTSVQNRTWSGR